MKFHLLSDLHLEFAPFSAPNTDADVVLLAGDIHLGVKAIAWIKDTFPEIPVIYVPGNHEYYGQAIPRHTLKLKELAQGSNIHVLDNDSFLLGDVVILGCTLWTDFELFGNPRVAGYFASVGMNDYRKIRVSPDYRKLQPLDTAGLHYRSRSWLTQQFTRHVGKEILVVTHHAPSALSLPQGYEEDILNAAFASRLDVLVNQSGACLWLHGHMHISRDYYIGDTHIICNPRGYDVEPNQDFKSDLTIEVNM